MMSEKFDMIKMPEDSGYGRNKYQALLDAMVILCNKI